MSFKVLTMLCVKSMVTVLFFTINFTVIAQNVNIPEPVPPPAGVRETFNLDPFYEQWIDVEGFPVVASAKVNSYALKEAVWLIRQMIKNRKDILQALAQNNVRFAVMAHDELTTDIPEHSDLQPDHFWDRRARGLGPTPARPAVSCGEENLLNYQGDPYWNENILVHEFAHAIHLMGLNTVDPGFDGRLNIAYNAAVEKGLWKNTYAITNKEEYWAEGTQSWFDTNGANDDQHNHVDTRDKLKDYDPTLASLLKEVFGDADWRYTQAVTRTYLAHLQGFDPEESPRFEWPPELIEKVPTDDPDPLLTLQSDTFDGSGQNLQSFWQVQNGDKSSWELKDGKLVVDAGFNQNFYFSDTSTRFYQLTNAEQFEVETAMVVEYTPACIVAGIVVYSGTGEWVTLKLHLHPNHSRIYAQFQYFVQGRIAGHDNYIETPDGTIPSRAGVFPIQARIKRDGDEYHTWYRLNAQDDWISAGNTIATLQGPVQTGIYVGICNDESQGGSLKVSFDNFRVTTDAITLEKEEIPYVDATVRFSTPPAESLYVGDQLMLNLNVTGGENITGYQATFQYDETALRYVSSANADFLLPDTYIATPIVKGNSVTIAATSLVAETNGDGTLATLTFEIVGQKSSAVTLTEVLFSDNEGTLTRPRVESTELIVTAFLKEDVNRDGVVDIQDLMLVDADFTQIGEYNTDVNEDGVVNIADLVLVAEALSSNATAAASALSHTRTFALSRADVEMWLQEAKQLNLTDPKSLRGIRFLEHLLLTITPEKTALLANYPNPFNPETWIPYQLAKPAMVTLTIYGANGQIVRQLVLGHQLAGIYQNRSRAAYWDGKNGAGESVASGVYLYTLIAGDFTATRKMLILK